MLQDGEEGCAYFHCGVGRSGCLLVHCVPPVARCARTCCKRAGGPCCRSLRSLCIARARACGFALTWGVHAAAACWHDVCAHVVYVQSLTVIRSFKRTESFLFTLHFLVIVATVIGIGAGAFYGVMLRDSLSFMFFNALVNVYLYLLMYLYSPVGYEVRRSLFLARLPTPHTRGACVPSLFLGLQLMGKEVPSAAFDEEADVASGPSPTNTPTGVAASAPRRHVDFSPTAVDGGAAAAHRGSFSSEEEGDVPLGSGDSATHAAHGTADPRSVNTVV
ncbi:hypothetical protein EON67_01640 [archaeon]|nr:MAG: hypothetical protein EON67_01640 [archaeon]